MKPEKEIVFYSDENVKVTNTRICIGDKTYLIANINTIETIAKMPHTTSNIFLFIGLITMILGIGAVIFVMGLIFRWRERKKYEIRMESSSGSISLISSEDKAYIDKIQQAINEAIIYRG